MVHRQQGVYHPTNGTNPPTPLPRTLSKQIPIVDDAYKCIYSECISSL